MSVITSFALNHRIDAVVNIVLEREDDVALTGSAILPTCICACWM